MKTINHKTFGLGQASDPYTKKIKLPNNKIIEQTYIDVTFEYPCGFYNKKILTFTPESLKANLI